MVLAIVREKIAPVEASARRLADRLAAMERQTPWFFRALSVLLLVIVVLGFGKSYFLRPAFANFPVSPLVLVHGGVMSAWFALFVLQTHLIAGRHVQLHKAAGWGSLALAVAIVATMIPTTYGFPARRFVADVPGYDFSADLAHITMVVHGNTAMLVQFVALYGAGVWLRRRRDDHRRLMALAAIAVVTPAASRLLTVVGPAGVTSEPLGIVAAFGLPMLLAGYDLAMERRMQPVTMLGIGLIYGSLVICGLVGKSPLGPQIALWLATN